MRIEELKSAFQKTKSAFGEIESRVVVFKNVEVSLCRNMADGEE